MFSDRELKILSIIGRKKVTLRVICNELFATDDKKPFDVEISVGGTIRRIIEKCEHHKLDWTLIRKNTGIRNRLLISKEKLNVTK